VVPAAIVVDPLLPPHADHFAAALWQVHLLHPATGAASLLAVGAQSPTISPQLLASVRHALYTTPRLLSCRPSSASLHADAANG
jgi:hypothetical protein